MDCYICYSKPDLNVPLLSCNHYVCPPCYCNLRNNNIHTCCLCQKKLKRGRKTNK